jgi:hypothetical protein
MTRRDRPEVAGDVVAVATRERCNNFVQIWPK